MPTPLSLGAEIATYLQGYTPSLGLNFSGVGTINLFVGGLPDTSGVPDLAASVFEGGGMGPVQTLVGGNASGSNAAGVNKLDRPRVQIRVRAAMAGYVAGNTLANGIFKALQDVGGAALNAGGQTFVVIMAQQSPVYLGRDERERHGWTQNFSVFFGNDQR